MRGGQITRPYIRILNTVYSPHGWEKGGTKWHIQGLHIKIYKIPSARNCATVTCVPIQSTVNTKQPGLRHTVHAHGTGRILTTFKVPFNTAILIFRLETSSTTRIKLRRSAETYSNLICAAGFMKTLLRTRKTVYLCSHRIKSPTRCTFSYVFILKFKLYMFRTDTPFISTSLRITVHTTYEWPLAWYVQTAVCTVIRKLLMMNGVSFRNMYSANFRINTYEKVHLVGLFIRLISIHGQYNITFIMRSIFGVRLLLS